MSKYWWEKTKEGEIEGMTEYVEKKLEIAKKNGEVTTEDMKEHFDEEEVEKFEANFPWKGISFDEYLLLMGMNVDSYHEVGMKILAGDDVKKEDKNRWYKAVKDYNRKTINQYQDVDARMMFKWLKRNKPFDKYIKKFNQFDDKGYADINVYNQMLKDFLIEAMIPTFNDVEMGNIYFDPSTMKVINKEEMNENTISN